MKHDLKCWPIYFQATWAGAKPFEIRNNDREFKVNDEVTLMEYIPEDEDFTGREIDGFIRYVSGEFCKDGYVAFTLDETRRRE